MVESGSHEYRLYQGVDPHAGTLQNQLMVSIDIIQCNHERS